ncbi:hypothetical protein C8A05DRAFT_31020 [Staphylotrichum tortipilum]|uniref:Uncharacterized protein n=1 Tax=Staphylotrichum tortipilum TaxID=2831512 RepID=A0AAN6RVN0_9PEZI|nr:hypothetical protein C8A05DRAFT_31020 [Staphylotrichum longicolle]
MFIYTGKLNWWSEAVDEVFVVALPAGPVRQGDQIFSFSQWTHDSKGNKKVTWCQAQTIDKVTREDNGEHGFHFGAGWYRYQVRATPGYETLTITMATPNGGDRVMVVDRMYQTLEGETNGSARLWAGRLNWPQYADNEPILVVVPEGFGDGKPALAFWQWTVDKDGNTKVNCVQNGTQKADTPAEGSLKFTLAADFTLDCTWDEKTENLAVRMGGDAVSEAQAIGPLTLAAHFRPHTDDFTPPGLPGEKVELEVFYPQVEQALPRIQSPLPFPPTLVETLSHTAAYVDRAGYLAKYAVDRYHALDKTYHALLAQVDDLTSQITTLTSQNLSLTASNTTATAQLAALQSQLTTTLDAASKAQAELTSQIHALQSSLATATDADADDRSALEDAQSTITDLQFQVSNLEKHIAALQWGLSDSARRIQEFQSTITTMHTALTALKGTLAAETAHNTALSTENAALKTTLSQAQSQLRAAQKALERTTADLHAAQTDSADKDSIIEGLENGLVAVKKDRDAKKVSLEELQKASSATISALEREIAELRAGGTVPKEGGEWPFPEGWPFKKEDGWPTPEDLLKQLGGL